MRKISYVVPVALAAFLSAGAAFAGISVNVDGTTTWDAKASTPTCIHVAVPGSEPTLAADGTTLADAKASKQNCVSGIDYQNLSSEQFNDLASELSAG